METDSGGEGREQQNIFVRTMAKRPELFCFLAALLCTLFTRYTQSSKPVTMNPPPPRRFFPSASPVHDVYYGNFQELASLMFEKHGELSFVMYYAPWCGKSIYIRKEFDKAAVYMHKQVHFVAVNCWLPSGSCRQTFKFPGFPVLFAYHTTLDGFQYHGVLKADYIVDFLEKLIYPLEYISNAVQMSRFFKLRDNAVVAYFDFNVSPQPPGFNQFYYAAMRTLEKDPGVAVSFGVVTNKCVAADFHLENSKDIIYRRVSNETLQYPEDANYTSSSIVKWVYKHKQKPTLNWIQPAGFKSSLLNEELKNGPALFMFTPHSPVASPHVHQYFNMLQEVTLDYSNCNNDTDISDRIRKSVYFRGELILKFLELSEKCKQVQQDLEKESRDYLFYRQCCQTVTENANTQKAQNVCDVCVNYQQSQPFNSKNCGIFDISDMDVGSVPLHRNLHCTEMMANYNVNEHISCCCKEGQISLIKEPKEIFVKHTDPLVENDAKNYLKKTCEKIRHRKKLGWSLSVDMESLTETLHYKSYSNFTGLKCKTNKTLKFYAMDTKHSSVFPRSLGVSLGSSNNQTRVVILDKQSEEQYVMNSLYSKTNVVNFILNFTSGALQRHLRSAAISKPVCDHNATECIVDLSTKTFHDIVMNNSKDVMVLFYVPWCGFCRSFSHVYISLAKYFHAASANLVFARINAAENDLPWHLTMDKYPSIVLFPSGRKEDSVAYPHNVQKTEPNLIQFILQFSSEALRLETALTICSKKCIYSNFGSIVHRIPLLHNEKQNLSRTVIRVKQRLQHYRQYQEFSEPTFEEYYKSRADMLIVFIQQLLFDMRVKDLQIKSAKQLHTLLLKSLDKFYLEQHKLEAIIKEFNFYQSQIRVYSASHTATFEKSNENQPG